MTLYNIIHMHIDRNLHVYVAPVFPVYARIPIDSTSYTKILSTCNNSKRDVHAYVLHRSFSGTHFQLTLVPANVMERQYHTNHNIPLSSSAYQ